MSKKQKFNIYAGLKNDKDTFEYHGTLEAESQKEATETALDCAVGVYLDYFEDLPEDVDLEELAKKHMDYRAIPFELDRPYDEDDIVEY